MSLINVQDMIDGYDHEALMVRADEYFAGAATNPYYQRKPLYNAAEASVLLRHFADILPHLTLYPNAKVLDFGAGTCWTSRMLAYLDCDVIATDVSRKALALGEQMIDRDPLRDQLNVSFLWYDGVRFDLPDNSVDRILCFDCFHHVPDQQASLIEFFRILRPGGIIAFSEPGPVHSVQPQSQFEMRNYNVVENDIEPRTIDRMAREIGFDGIRMCYSAPSRLVALETLEDLISGDADPVTAKREIDDTAHVYSDLRVFFLSKPGADAMPCDSRSNSGLAHTLKVTARRKGRVGRRIIGALTATNTGSALWLPAGLPKGSVSVGVSLYDVDGNLVDLDYRRIKLRPGSDCAGRERDGRILAEKSGRRRRAGVRPGFRRG